MSVFEEVHFEAEQLTLCVSILILEDRIAELTEEFFVVIDNMPFNDLVIDRLSVAPAITAVCITDDDGD